MEKICAVSGQKFIITEEDLAFYKKMGVPAPTLCPEERMRRRLAYRNESSLYHRTCDGTGKKIISMHSPDKIYPVYENEYWWGDEWDGLDFGRTFDAKKPFFKQFKKLLDVVPRMARVQQGENQNSQFTNCSSYNKNGYLLFSSNRNEDCQYGWFNFQSQSCVDNLSIIGSELCYEGVDGDGNYNTHFSISSQNCRDSYFLKRCINCKNCFGCVNLKHKEYYFLNEPLSKEAYELKIKSLELHKHSNLENLRSHFQNFVRQHPQKFMEGIQNENCSGNIVFNSKNAQHCFDVDNLEDCKYCNDFLNAKDCYDISFYGCDQTNQLLYECEGVGHGIFNSAFSKLCWGGCKNLQYCYECFKCEDCFGCIGLKAKQYCIFNTQYTKEQYFELRETIINHMNSTQEYGEFFPLSISPFGYNETVAQEHFPLEEKRAQAQNYGWKKPESKTLYEGPKNTIPDSITEVSPSICDQILACEISGKNYRITKPEYEFYKKINLPIPRLCPDERHKRRIALRNPRRLYERKCDECEVMMQTTFAPERPEKVLCEDCYLEIVD